MFGGFKEVFFAHVLIFVPYSFWDENFSNHFLLLGPTAFKEVI
jgi:hypothetical protein